MGKLFGTDGVRGVANVYPMNVETAVKLGRAAAHIFKTAKKGRHKIIIGKDTRLSGYMLESALMSGICSMGVDALLIGHLELIWDLSIFQIIPHEPFLGKGFVGLILAISLLFFLFRRFLSPVKDLSVPEDYYLLILLFLIVLFGSQMDWARRWYEYGELTLEDYRDYLTSLIMLKPELPYNTTFSGHSFMLILHVFFANIFLIFFPFSQSMHSFLSLPINKLRRG